ncbi:AEC family transporter [Paenibacillus sp. 23TSA30-6]|uniref:AEC family transporter n=1 Tax=Paenibacillus sp. 23TSA30-6 TaxID=2546104 RepID=UPI0017878002|nr:AEC family transporter [Paenibacillus sp. 23TSA30-6]MBE0338752.1 AEC family transporter [Paenibacillus sp. 23TSA30-6]
MATVHIFIILIPIFFVILIGYFAGLFKAFNPASSKGLNTLVTKFALPAHLFIGITTTPRETLIQKWPFLVALLLGVIGFYIVLLVGYRLIAKKALTESSMFALNSTQPSFAFMGIPVLGSLFGSAAVAIPIAITGIVVNAILDPLASILGTVGQRKTTEADAKGNLFKVTMKSVLHGLSEPLACVPLIGVVLTLCGFQAPKLLQSMFDQLGNITSGTALFAIGVTIGIKKITFSPKALSIAVLKAIVMPIVMLGIAVLVGLSHEDVTKAVLLVAFPGSAVAAMIATRYETLETEAASAFVISSVLSLISLPLLISLLI